MVTLGQYMDQKIHSGNHILFLNEPHDAYLHPGEEKLLSELSDDWSPRPVFAFGPEDHHTLMFPESIANGHGWHYHGPVWHTQVVGRKMWWLHPPSGKNADGTMPPGDQGLILEDGSHVFEANVCEYLSLTKRPPNGTLTYFANPGDTVVLPDAWWHGTCALDNWTIGTGGWLKEQPVDDAAKQDRLKRGW
mmetsp:Transcript_42937/g.77258  ORF Transcript_42937/g.77258 Transcript_42937/m.77258 type:complete len:191 (-) Transcript_42937:154-726(-)